LPLEALAQHFTDFQSVWHGQLICGELIDTSEHTNSKFFTVCECKDDIGPREPKAN
jgi:hypothetical protein